MEKVSVEVVGRGVDSGFLSKWKVVGLPGVLVGIGVLSVFELLLKLVNSFLLTPKQTQFDSPIVPFQSGVLSVC